MGTCFSLDEEEKSAKQRSHEIDRELEVLRLEDQKTMKLLLLGAGESGKSTLVKQMKLIHSHGFTGDELESFKPAVLDNLFASVKYVLNGMGTLMISLENPYNKVYVHHILSCQVCFDENYVMLPHITDAIMNLLYDKGFKYAISKGHEYELNDSATYYFDNVNRICSRNYFPTEMDVLRARVRTTGVIETCFTIHEVIFRLFDVGGQRSERRKWIQCFDDVRALLFVAALSGYDCSLYEDPFTNRLDESLRLFCAISNNRFFTSSSMILFLNKYDLFSEKIIYSGRHLRHYYPGYTGPDRDVERAAAYIQHLFLAQCQNANKVLFPHFTTATDTRNVQFVFKVVMETIIQENLKNATLL